MKKNSFHLKQKHKNSLEQVEYEHTPSQKWRDCPHIPLEGARLETRWVDKKESECKETPIEVNRKIQEVAISLKSSAMQNERISLILKKGFTFSCANCK